MMDVSETDHQSNKDTESGAARPARIAVDSCYCGSHQNCYITDNVNGDRYENVDHCHRHRMECAFSSAKHMNEDDTDQGDQEVITPCTDGQLANSNNVKGKIYILEGSNLPTQLAEPGSFPAYRSPKLVLKMMNFLHYRLMANSFSCAVSY